MDRERKALLARGLARLSERQRFVIERRFGLAGRPTEHLSEIAVQLGLSRERVRQIEAEAKVRLAAVLLPPRRGGRRSR
jgi:RNA polymerase nonessential primary-like sigma factor